MWLRGCALRLRIWSHQAARLYTECEALALAYTWVRMRCGWGESGSVPFAGSRGWIVKKCSAANQAHGRGVTEGEEPVARSSAYGQTEVMHRRVAHKSEWSSALFFILLICVIYTICTFRLIPEAVMVRRKSWLLVISRGSHKSRSADLQTFRSFGPADRPW